MEPPVCSASLSRRGQSLSSVLLPRLIVKVSWTTDQARLCRAEQRRCGL